MHEWLKMEFEEDEIERVEFCDLCQAPSEKSNLLFVKFGLPVVQCSVCGLIQVNPRLRQDILWQRYSDEYFQNEYLPQHGEYNEQANYDIQAPYLRELDRFAKKPGRLLDIGCAIGLFLAAARVHGWQVVGNELSPFAADYAGKQFNIKVIPGKSESLELEPRSFDAVTMWETIEHVQSPSATMRKAAELIKPSGVLALSTPNIGSLSYRILKDKWWIVAPKEHIYYFSPRTITRLLDNAGFQIKKMWTAGTDIYYLRNTYMGRTVMPLHIRLAELRTEATAAPSGGKRESVAESWIMSFLRKLKRYGLPVLHNSDLADTLFVYAVRRG